MPLTSGTRLGVYEVTVLIGVGGMGEVYKATDTNLKRAVAIKVLPALVAADAERLARFQREAEVLAALNHPNIAAIYGLERSGTTTALVMELVEGDDLSQRIERGAIPIDEALPIAKQIADALEAAHEHGIIHRDLKPANIKVRDDGTVKVLDFGLAKALEPSGAPSTSAMNSPTLTARATQMGMILGTAAYMSPEQARGRAVDRRADVWAFGVVLYEMLTGRRAFDGDDISITLASVLKDELGWQALPADLPAPVRRLLRRCVEKDPKRRLSAMGDARLELDDAGSTSSEDRLASPAPAGSPTAPLWRTTAFVLFVALAGITAWMLLRAKPVADVVRFAIHPPDKSVFEGCCGTFSLSPDGRHLAFVATADGKKQLWVQALDSLTASPVPGTDGASELYWSANSRFVAFSDSSFKLKKVDLAGGMPVTLSDTDTDTGAWSADGVILFSGRDHRLYRISDGGGQPVAVTELDNRRQETWHQWPIFLPDGQRFIYSAQSSDGSKNALYLASLDSSARTPLVDVLSFVAYAPGYLFYQRDGTLMVQPFDEKSGRLVGNAATMVDGLDYRPRDGRADFSVSATGRLAYRASGRTETANLTWFDRQGKPAGTVGEPAIYRDVALSPDGRSVAVSRGDVGKGDIWIIDVERNVPTRLTSDPADDEAPIWSADGTHVIFRSNRKGLYDLYQRAPGGIGADELLLETTESKSPTGVSPDGKLLLFTRNISERDDVWALPLIGERTPFPVVQTEFRERNAVFSPDGHWIAYESNDLGSWQIYVQPFPTGVRVRVSTTTGANPQWSADGKQLFYTTVDYLTELVDVTSPAHPSVQKDLFARPRGSLRFAVDRSGQRILSVAASEETAVAPITIVLNWQEELKRKVGRR